MELTEESFQRKLKLSALFSSGGWLLFEKELKEMREFALLRQEQFTRQTIDDNVTLGKANCAIAERLALDAVFCKIANLQDELDDSV